MRVNFFIMRCVDMHRFFNNTFFMYSQSVKKLIVTRPISNHASSLFERSPLLQRIFAARGVYAEEELDRRLLKLPSPWLLSGMTTMVEVLTQALVLQQRITIVADFDADGATSCAVAIKGLRALGAHYVDFVVPNRFEYGYGLTPEIVDLVKLQNPDIIITVDNGISSIEGVASANALGIKVLITDHHLPGEELPAAAAIVNPNLHDDLFPSKSLAGVGVIFYVLMALRSRLREKNWFTEQQLAEPNLAQLLDFVALGTVADVVALDQTNRILVHQGLLRIRTMQCHSGLLALITVAGKNPATLSTTDLGYTIAPRLNAAGRMDTMALGIECLLTDDNEFAKHSALLLDQLNTERREVEEQMKQEAMGLLTELQLMDAHYASAGVCLYNKDWHQGVIGILAARMKDKLHRPVIAFAPVTQGATDGEIKGSARSIPGLHIRDVLNDIATAHPKILSKFGGHAMAAGLTIMLHDYPAFVLAFNEIVTQRLNSVDLEQKIFTDGELTEEELTLEGAEVLQQAATWGQTFPEPLFHGVFDVIQVRIVGQRHLKFVLRQPNGHVLIDAIAFFVDHTEQWLGLRQIKAVYKLDANEYRGQRQLQLLVSYIEKII